MISLLRVKSKYLFFKKSNLIMLLIMILLITCISKYIDDKYKNPSKIYSVAIIDNDESQFSSSFVEKIREYNEIEVFIKKDIEECLRNLSKGKYDAIYQIKDGFQDKIINGEFYNILVCHKENNSTDINWLNDQISLVVVRQWLYVDVFNRIRELNPNFSEVDFKEKFEKSIMENEILSMEIVEINEEDISNKYDASMGMIFLKFIWAIIIIMFLINFGKGIIDDREKGIILRLQLSGINKLEYYTSILILSLLNIMIPFTISYLLFGYINHNHITSFFSIILITTIYAITTCSIFTFIGLICKSKKSYSFFGQLYLLASIVFGTGLLDGMHKIIDNISWIFPLKWYMYF